MSHYRQKTVDIVEEINDLQLTHSLPRTIKEHHG